MFDGPESLQTSTLVHGSFAELAIGREAFSNTRIVASVKTSDFFQSAIRKKELIGTISDPFVEVLPLFKFSIIPESLDRTMPFPMFVKAE